MDPIIQWVGGKKRLLGILQLLLPSYQTYFEPFLGGGALLYNLLPKNAKIYELNINIYNLYINIKNNVEEIITQLKLYETEYKNSNNKKQYYLTKRSEYNSLDYSTEENSKNKTIILLFLNKTCFNSLYRENKSGHFNVPVGNIQKKNFTICNQEQLRSVSKYLNNNNVDIYNSDFSKFVDTITSDDIVYLDPPYYPLKKTSFVDYDKNSFGIEDHDKLLKILDILNAKNIKFILSNSNNSYFKEKLKKYNIFDISISRTLNSNINDRKDSVCEIIVTNFPLNKTYSFEINKDIYEKLYKHKNILLKANIIKKQYCIIFNECIIQNISKSLYNFILLNNIIIELINVEIIDTAYYLNIKYFK